MSHSVNTIQPKVYISTCKPSFTGDLKALPQATTNVRFVSSKPVQAQQAIVYFTAQKKPAELPDLLKQIDRANLKKHIDYLASEELAGRALDTEGINKAKEYILKEFKEYGLKPLRPVADANYQQRTLFEVVYHEKAKDKKGMFHDLDRSEDAIIVEDKSCAVNNLIGYIPAKVKTDKYIMLMAHYDHIGRNIDSGKVYTGADDNASGVAAMLEIARIMAQNRYDKNVVFVATSGEEIKCLGSKYLAKQLKLHGFDGKVEAVNLDCLGAKGKFAVVEGWQEELNQKPYEAAKQAAKDLNIQLRKEGFETNSHTDAAALDRAGIPAISIVWAYDLDHKNRKHFHEPTDRPEKINYDGVESSTKLALSTIFNLAKQ